MPDLTGNLGHASVLSMKIVNFGLPRLGAMSYLVLSDEGMAAWIDPPRDVEAGLAALAAEGAKLQWALLTHLPEDYVAGHVELAHRMSARIGVSARADAAFPHVPLAEGEKIQLGSLELEA